MQPVQQQAVFERVLGMLGELQKHYSEKLSAIVSQASRPEGASQNTPGPAESPSKKDSKGSEAGTPKAPESGKAASVEPVAARGDAAKAPDSGKAADAESAPGGCAAVAEDPAPLKEEPAGAPSGESEDVVDEEEAEDEQPEPEDAADRAPCESQPGQHSPSSCPESTSKNLQRSDSVSSQKTADPKAKQKPAGAKKGAKKASKKRDGIHCIKTVQCGASSAVRCALTVKDEVWVADWSGTLTVRDKEHCETLKHMLPSDALVWCMTLVEVAQVPMVWVGRERQGIPVFHATTRELLCMLNGGHVGNVMAFAIADGPKGRTDIWSAGNDFSIRCWHVEPGNGRTAGTVPLKGSPLQVRRGNNLHWHGNSVRCLLRIGPTLWSGADDKAIVLWKCADGSRTEVIENAHDGGVTTLVVAGRGVWSSGPDGRVKEWSLGGVARECTREITLDEPLRALCVVGQDVWMCGQSKKIAVYSGDMQKVASLEGHSSFVSSLLLVDRMEVRTVWSSSLSDKTLRVWRHVLRGGNHSMAELVAANLMYEEQQWSADEKLRSAEEKSGKVEAELAAAALEFAEQLQEILGRAARAERARDAAEAERARAAEREGWARRAETEAKAEVAELRAKLQAACDAQQAALVDAEAKAAELLAIGEARKKSEAQRAAAQQEATALAAQLAQERGRGQDLEQRLCAALASVEEAAATAESLRAQLREQGEDLNRIQGELSQEQEKCKALEAQVEELSTHVAELEQERDDAQAREKALALRYAELDVFKLDVIARELKTIDRLVESIRGDARGFQEAVKKFVNSRDQETSTKVALSLVDSSTKLRGIIRDVIERCLSETQKLHVGAATKDPTAAGVLKDGGKMAGYVIAADGTEDSGSAHPRQKDEMRRERRRGSDPGKL